MATSKDNSDKVNRGVEDGASKVDDNKGVEDATSKDENKDMDKSDWL